ncbi:MAG TPA: YdbL family protein [Oleiagrimonas sp.]|nr:YdbL family protein [Oleiagrimonas sp.]
MRKCLLCLSVLLLTALAGCVTINVYFPKAAAEKAAGQFIGSVIDAGTTSEKSAQPASASSAAKPAADDAQGQPLALRVLNFVVPAAYAADQPNLRIHTPGVDAIHARMRQRYEHSLGKLLDKGVVGFTHDGLVAVRDASSVPLARRTKVNAIVAAENRDRKALYREIANANGHPGWEAKIRNIFAALWIKKAHDGWYYQNASGAWTRK